MKKIQSQLKTIAKSLASLADKIEKMSAQLDVGTVLQKAKAEPKTKSAAKTASAKVKAAAEGKDTVLDKVLDVIKKSRNGATIANLKAKTALESRQLSNALYKLSKKGKIKAKSRGVYVKA